MITAAIDVHPTTLHINGMFLTSTTGGRNG